MIHLPAGMLRHRVTIQKPKTGDDEERDELGERLTDWDDVAFGIPAFVRPLDAREQFIAAQLQSSTTHKVTIRYSSEYSDMDASWRVMFGTRPLVLQGPPKNIDEENVYFELDCIEGPRVE